MLEQLEKIKQKGAYKLTLLFGEGEGADDSDVPVMERNIIVHCSPVGYLGSLKAMYKGKVKSFLEFDFDTKPTVISNPPKSEEYEEEGFYCWGTESALSSYEKNKRLFPF